MKQGGGSYKIRKNKIGINTRNNCIIAKSVHQITMYYTKYQ